MAGRSRAELQTDIAALSAFRTALINLMRASAHQPYGFMGRAYVPADHATEAEWMGLKGQVDRLAPRAANAFLRANVVMSWKPAGTPPGTSIMINPATQWATILESHPRFPVEQLEACLQQALGSLEAEIESPRSMVTPRERREPRTLNIPAAAAGKWIGGILSALLVAFIIYKLHWN